MLLGSLYINLIGFFSEKKLWLFKFQTIHSSSYSSPPAYIFLN